MTRIDERPLAEGATKFAPTALHYAFAILAIIWFLFGLAGGGYQSKLNQVQKNDPAAYLPKSAESTQVNSEAQAFNPVTTVPGFLVFSRDEPLDGQDRAAILAATARVKAIDGVAADQVGSPEYSENSQVASLAVPLVGSTGGVAVKPEDLVDVEKDVLATARQHLPDGLSVHSAGPAGFDVALADAFSGIDGTLLIGAGLVVVLILLVVYRSPILWFFPLFSAMGVALGAASFIIYQLALHDVLTLNGQSQGILYVLVLGAGTDYALLIIRRYREELNHHESRIQAMDSAWRGTAPAILASGVTVMLGVLCLGLSELNSDRSLGPVCAIGIGCTLVTMLLFLPLFLLVGRWIFWPRIPHVDNRSVEQTHSTWVKLADALSRRSRASWIAATLILLALAAGLTQLRASGLQVADAFTNNPDAVVGQRIYDANFPQGAGAPVVIIANNDRVEQVIDAVSRVPGVVSEPGGVCIQADYGKLAGAGRQDGSGGEVTGCVPVAYQVAPVDGRIIIDAQLRDRYDTPQALTTVTDIRAAIHAIPGADALVGGQSAVTYDTQQASRHDRNLIIPVVLVVITLVLALLLRAIVAPLILVGTVVLSFAATLGACALLFNHVFHFKNADPGFPLFAFVFLVALGVDYNIFLMTRVREESVRHGTRAGIRRGLIVTGGVITSAGIVLAATFAILGVVPLIFLSQVGIAVALGVLIDTLVVRSILVPALSYDLDRRIWWPSTLARARGVR